MTVQNTDAAPGGDNIEKNNDTPPAAEPKAAEGTSEVAKTEGVDEPEQVVRTKSATLDNGEAPAIQIMEDGSVHISGQPVAKGRSFTQARINTIRENMEQLAGLMKEVAPEDFEELVDKLAQELPRDTQYRQGVRGQPTPGPKKDKPRRGMMKNEDGEDDGDQDPIMQAIANLGKSVEGLAAKVETIEKARSPSTSVNDDGGTDDTTDVEKSQPKAGSSAFWKGSLF